MGFLGMSLSPIGFFFYPCRGKDVGGVGNSKLRQLVRELDTIYENLSIWFIPIEYKNKKEAISTQS